MTNLELREWLQHAFVSKLFDAAMEFAAHDSLLDAPKLFERCISLAPHVLRRLEDPNVSGGVRIAGIRGGVDYNDACKRMFSLMHWEPPGAMESCRAKVFLARAMISTHLFAKTEAEAMCLLWRLIKKMIESFGMRWARGYMAEAACEAKHAMLFNGPCDATAETEFEIDRQSEVDRMADLFQLPAVGALANEAELRT